MEEERVLESGERECMLPYRDVYVRTVEFSFVLT